MKEKQIGDDLFTLIQKYLYCEVESEYHIIQKKKGIIQGSPLSPLLSNIYMNEFDHVLEKKYAFCRFSDDINIYLSTQEEAIEVMEEVKNWLYNNLYLSLNKQKSGIYPALHRKYLGYQFKKIKDTETVLVQKSNIRNPSYYSSWSTSAIQRIDKNYHIINDGILTKKDYTLLFENSSGKHYIPVEATSKLNIYSNVMFSTDIFRFAQRKNLEVAIYDKYGEYIGSFTSIHHYHGTKTMLEQAQIYNDEAKRLSFAKKIEIASLHNIRENLRYYNKYKNSEILKSAIEIISQGIKIINEAKKLEDVLLIEARLKKEYYKCWDEIISNNNFLFERRTRRPPKNELNALISFGNTVLYQRIATEIHKTSLDIRISFAHAANHRNESLNLDIAELFKPIIVDRAIFTVIHNREMQKDLHFEQRNDGGVYLNKEGKKIFLKRLEQKIYQKITVQAEPMTYDSLMRREVYKIQKAILCGEDYKPYKYH